MASRSVRSIVDRRLRNQLLTGPLGKSPKAVVEHMCAVQAQDFGPARWSVGARTGSPVDAGVERALARGQLLRTHVLRPTWHIVSATDIRWLLELTAPRVKRMSASSHKRLGLDEKLFTRSSRLLEEALSHGKHLTRKEIREFLRSRRVSLEDNRLSHLLMRAELEGIICSGVPEGKQSTHALLAERASGAVTMTRDDALRELVLRYLRSHGPATEKDLRWWASLTAADVKRGLELAGERVQAEQVEGLRFWSVPVGETDIERPVAHLLQTYDEYIVGYTESRGLISLPGVAIWNHPYGGVLIVNGMHAGNWKRSVHGEELRVEIALHRKLSRPEVRAVDEAASRLGNFFGLRITLYSHGA